METTEQTTNRVPLAARVDPDVYNAIEQIAKDEERTISSTVERLLKQSPGIRQILDEQAAATVTG